MKHILIYSLAISLFTSCNNAKSQNNHTSKSENTEMSYKHTNELIKATSPYLQQHAHNPVNWVEWSEEAFQRAKEEDKLVLVSVGYSACHWCHVMEHESFEDTAVANVMNDNFICIKVDREERPDVDGVYMTAVQLMTQRGGWPLNCFTLPDGRPIFGGTYFPKDQWVNTLNSLVHTYKNDKQKVLEYADNLTKGIAKSELIDTPEKVNPVKEKKLEEMLVKWSTAFDERDGGPARAPKFPLPNNYDYLMRYAAYKNDASLDKHVKLTLDKMAQGGIYDQVGGGFSRYSTDMLWKVPHFEKMMYDNGQLVSLYARAYSKYKNPSYKDVVYQTLDWVQREMTTSEGAFYSALDADSEGEEGKFYIWTKKELQTILGDDFEWVKDYYNVNGKGFWEHENYILLRDQNKEDFAKSKGWSLAVLDRKVKALDALLLKERAKKERPGLDDKNLTAWNAMMMKGYADAYMVFKEERFLKAALKNANWIKTKQTKTDGSLWHTYKEGKSTINGFLDDYAHVADAYIQLYQATFDETWIKEAEKLTNYAITHFQNSESKMFYFTNSDSELIARKMEVNDNVIPASNSVMANNLYLLGTLLENETWKSDALQMLANVYEGMDSYGSGYSNWAILALKQLQPTYEVAIVGVNWRESLLNINETYKPNAIYLGGSSEGNLALLENKLVEGETMIYVCQNKSCQMPTNEVGVALSLMK